MFPQSCWRIHNMFNVINVSLQATGLYMYILKVSQLKITEMSKGMLNISWSYKAGIIQVSARQLLNITLHVVFKSFDQFLYL
jgi:hypothetical protein